MLEGLGLLPEQEQTYRQLLSRPHMSVADLVVWRPDWSAERTEGMLRGLVELGLAVQTDQTGTTYAAISPDVAIAELVRTRINAARNAEHAVPELMMAFWRGRPAQSRDFMDVVTDEHSVTERWYQLQRAAQREVRGFDCPPYFADPTDPDPMELQRLSQGVSYRVIYAEEVLLAPGRWRDLEAGIYAGEQARVMQRLPAKLTLFDDFAATLPVTGRPSAADDGSKAVVVVHRSPMLDALSALFEAYWDQAVPLVLTADGVPTTAAPMASMEDTRLIRLLAAGFGNDAIQRALGVSASTVQRRVHELMDRLGAKTRFQAGLLLGRMTANGRPAEPEAAPQRDAARLDPIPASKAATPLSPPTVEVHRDR
jgi:hypothetical protein